MEIVDYGPLWETMRRNNVTQYQLLQSGIDNHTLDSLKKGGNITMLTLEKLCKIIGCTPNDIVSFKQRLLAFGLVVAIALQKKKRADSYTAIRPSEIILLSESVFVFSAKAMPIHGDLPALPTIVASEIAAPAPSIGNPDGSKCSVPVLCTAGSSQRGQAHKPRHGQDTGL